MSPYRKHADRRVRRRAAGLLFVLAMAAGCSSKTLDTAPPTIEPAQPGQSPPQSQAVAGVVRPLDARPQAAIFDHRTAQLVILTSGSASAPNRIALLDSRQTSPRLVELPGPATGLTGNGNGTAYLAGHGGYLIEIGRAHV